MRITESGKDYISIDECNIADPSLLKFSKVHIIRLSFKLPTTEKVDYVLRTFSTTNRFVVNDNIKFYNDLLRNTNKKYYVVNKEGDGLVSFYKRNNKVLLDTTKLSLFESAFVFTVALSDILSLTEVMIVPEKRYREYIDIFNNWSGNLILV